MGKVVVAFVVSLVVAGFVSSVIGASFWICFLAAFITMLAT